MGVCSVTDGINIDPNPMHRTARDVATVSQHFNCIQIILLTIIFPPSDFCWMCLGGTLGSVCCMSCDYTATPPTMSCDCTATPPTQSGSPTLVTLSATNTKLKRTPQTEQDKLWKNTYFTTRG